MHCGALAQAKVTHPGLLSARAWLRLRIRDTNRGAASLERADLRSLRRILPRRSLTGLRALVHNNYEARRLRCRLNPLRGGDGNRGEGSSAEHEGDETAHVLIRLYVTASSAGLVHETTKPKPGIQYAEFRPAGITLYVDPAIERPTLWRLVFHRFPMPHVRALWNGSRGFSPTGNPAFVSEWEGLSPGSAPWTPDK